MGITIIRTWNRNVKIVETYGEMSNTDDGEILYYTRHLWEKTKGMKSYEW